MKRTVAWLGLALLACLALITAVKFRATSTTKTENAVSGGDRERVASFWSAYNQATALRTQGKFAQAADLYRAALRINPNHEDSLYYLGSCLYELGNYAEAEQELRSLIALNPESGRAYGELGRVLASPAPGAAHDLSAARQAFERELELYTEQAGPLLEVGGLELNRGNLAAAEQDFRTATKLGSAEAEFLLGYTLFLQGRSAEATRALENVLAKYRAGNKLNAKGVLSEGDVLPDPSKPLTALQRAALKSMLLLSFRNGGRPGTPGMKLLPALRARPAAVSGAGVRLTRLQTGVRAGGRAAWSNFGRDGRLSLAVGGANFMLYRRQGDSYSDETRAAGLADIHDVWEPYWVDFNGDGYPDLYLVRPGPTGSAQNLLYVNRRDGTFADRTAEMGLSGKRPTMAACFGNFSGAGRTDLLEVGGAGSGSSVRLFRNQGTRFVDVTASSGLSTKVTAVDCAVSDYDGDGRPDIFVQFWRREAHLFHNQGGGKFVDVTQRAGLAGLGMQGYSSIFLDYDHDGRPDLLVTAQAQLEEVARWRLQPDGIPNCATPRLFHNQGDGTFREVTREAGLTGCYNTAQAIAADFDGDGWPDLLLISGGWDAQQLGPSVLLRNLRGRFVPWAELPDASRPANYVGAALGAAAHDGSRELYLNSGPLPGGLNPGGLFRITARAPEHLGSRRIARAVP